MFHVPFHSLYRDKEPYLELQQSSQQNVPPITIKLDLNGK